MNDGLPAGAVLREISAHYNHLTIPRELRVLQPLPPEMWGKLVVEEGSLLLRLGEGGTARPVTGEVVIPKNTPFAVEAGGGAARFYLEYYHEPVVDDPQVLAGMLGRGGASRAPSGA